MTLQFPIETTMISLSGGSFIVSGSIGIGFGLYPALIATRMNSIEALRHE